MKVINFNDDFTDSKTLKKSILCVLNNLFKYKDTFHRTVFNLLMTELCSKIDIVEIDDCVENKFWVKSWGPSEPCLLKPEHKDSYFIYIKKYHCSKKVCLSVLSTTEYVQKYFNAYDVDKWLRENEQKLNCKCKPCCSKKHVH